jgi:hypothetical protein
MIDGTGADMKGRIFAQAVAFLLVALPAAAQRRVAPAPGGGGGSWVIIGQTQAGHGKDHDVLVVKGRFDNFRKLKLKVTDAPVNMDAMVVTFDAGGAQRISLRQKIEQGGESRVVDLQGSSRSIRTVEFWYDTHGILKGTANITVFGRH